jgi:hypothetical protein
MFVWEQFFYVFGVFSVLLIIGQRVAKRHQGIYRFALILLAALWMWWRFGQFPWEMVTAFIAALFLSFVFWLIIGRYNPAGNEDDEKIKVYGLDD